ncbi:hypothetical protein KCH_11180 [Kitasatospora cheerisanensis KCTC 2395]|uniref:Uncharacterized protein n=1 Tax=Kitasatospora cheerisanensis KCTC 2395 TaxID=1348663 RepID=A0A066YZQ9_9ACTN|nr:hypothetical protein KCH_11180 [Kitasatospora cheerisanensis KCTC 2395]
MRRTSPADRERTGPGRELDPERVSGWGTRWKRPPRAAGGDARRARRERLGWPGLGSLPKLSRAPPARRPPVPARLFLPDCSCPDGGTPPCTSTSGSRAFRRPRCT